MDNTNIESKRFCAYCGKEVAINKKRCLYCGSLLNLPIYKQSVLLNKNTSFIQKENIAASSFINENLNLNDMRDDMRDDMREEKPISISKKVIITILMCLIPAIGPLVGMVVGFVYKGSSSKGSQRYSFGKTITIASLIVLIYNIALFFVFASIYIDYINVNG